MTREQDAAKDAADYGMTALPKKMMLNAGVCPACAAQAQKYAALRKPYLINDMAMQDVLLDRRRVYQKLQVHRCAMRLG